MNIKYKQKNCKNKFKKISSKKANFCHKLRIKNWNYNKVSNAKNNFFKNYKVKNRPYRCWKIRTENLNSKQLIYRRYLFL